MFKNTIARVVQENVRRRSQDKVGFPAKEQQDFSGVSLLQRDLQHRPLITGKIHAHGCLSGCLIHNGI